MSKEVDEQNIEETGVETDDNRRYCFTVKRILFNTSDQQLRQIGSFRCFEIFPEFYGK